jgi:hypothetical protein
MHICYGLGVCVHLKLTCSNPTTEWWYLEVGPLKDKKEMKAEFYDWN